MKRQKIRFVRLFRIGSTGADPGTGKSDFGEFLFQEFNVFLGQLFCQPENKVAVDKAQRMVVTVEVLDYLDCFIDILGNGEDGKIFSGDKALAEEAFLYEFEPLRPIAVFVVQQNEWLWRRSFRSG